MKTEKTKIEKGVKKVHVSNNAQNVPRKTSAELLESVTIHVLRGAQYNMFHHTTVQGLLGMLKNGRFRLSRVDKMNDGTENFPNADRTYVLSLSTAPTENVAMWVVYGRARKGAIRLRFPGKELLDLANRKEISVFPSSKKGKSSGVPVESIRLAYVYYLPESGNCVHAWNGEIFEMADGEKEREKNMAKLAGCSKRLGWRYEMECRLIVTLKEKIDDDKIEIDFTDVLRAMLRYGKNGDRRYPSIVTGPWMERCALIERLREWVRDESVRSPLLGDVKSLLDRAKAMPLESNPVRESGFKNNLRMDPCGGCRKANKNCDDCEGPYRAGAKQ